MRKHRLQPGAGVAFKPQHFDAIMADPQRVDFIEVHAENYLGAGGLPHTQLTALRDQFPLSVHGVGLSLGGVEPLDHAHLQRLRDLCHRYAPVLFSEHLAWSSNAGEYLGDLLPISYDAASLQRVCEHVDQLQSALGREVLIENPALYLDPLPDTMDEVEFLDELSGRTGCGLLLDLNNLLVTAHNCGRDANDYLARFSWSRVGEIHLAGHTRQQLPDGKYLLIDDHGSHISDAVWGLFSTIISRGEAIPALVEWDRNLPSWLVLGAEMDCIRALLGGAQCSGAPAGVAA